MMARLIPWACVALLVPALPGQIDRAEREAQELAERCERTAVALSQWAADFEETRLGPQAVVRRSDGLQPPYVQRARAAGFLEADDYERLTHLDVLQKMLFFAESHPTEALGDAALSIASVGFGRSLVDRDAVMLRDLGHWSIMRMDHRGIWFLVMRAAAGERLPFLAAERSDEGIDFARQVTALKLLGMKALPVFRSTIEGELVAADPRVRLAAVEALGFQRRIESLPVLTRTMATERHPVVSQSVVGAVLATLRAGRGRIDAEVGRRTVRAALRLLGMCGWRTDMELLDLVEQFPSREAVPVLIDLLDRGEAGSDALVAAVNRNARPLLRDRAGNLLRRMTGALVPAGDAEAWRAFWRAEQHNIVVPERLADPEQTGNTQSTFFGIPVKGSEIAFLIDTSGSMDTAAGGTVGESGRSRRQPSRLDAAKEQLLLAVQSMPSESRYHLLTFDADARVWNKKPVPPTPQAIRSLHELIGQFHAEGGTNVYAALAEALALQQLRYGEAAQTEVDELFLLTDGEPTVGELKDPDAILAAIAAANKYLKVRINTVYTGQGKGADFLRRLAAENGGVFVQR